MWKWFIIREEDVKAFHDCLIGPATIYLEHEVIHISNIFHPTTCEEVWLLDMLV
jgi:hypothetical protein